jgi:hypothetical protein
MTRGVTSRIIAAQAVALVWSFSLPVLAQCPVGTKITIDFDLPGSGYAETSNNWTTWNTTPCNGAGYRYLSHTVGDGSRKGKAIWKPAIAVSGHYLVRTGFRATENRTTEADYFAYDDVGATVHKVVDQSQGSGCEWLEMGTFYCVPGGACRVELDGTDDSQSDCADVTTYELLDCEGGTGGGGGSGGGTSAGRCDGIRAHAGWEVCEETATTCKGVFTDGAGCTAYCAAAGMSCVARFGGEPGCQKESQNVLTCAEDNGHASDWCECEGPPIEVDAGGVAGQAGAGGAGGSVAQDASVAGAGGTGPEGGTGGVAGTQAGGTGGAFDAAFGGTGGDLDGGRPADGVATDGDGGCGCRLGLASSRGWAVLPLVVLMVLRRRWS